MIRKRIAFLSGFVLLLIGVGIGSLMRMSRESPERFSFVQTRDGIEEYRLRTNGLKILLKEDRSAPVVAFMVSYKVGSRNEPPDHTGLAHLLEHMMFKGTERYHKSRGTQIAALLEAAGAVLNANTGLDSTHYYEWLPSDQLELAMDIEADRMRGILLLEKDFLFESDVVKNELERYFDSPTVALVTAVWNAAFTRHPYREPVIGWREHVAAMPLAEVRAFYDTYYQPNNAVLTLVGDFEKQKVLDQIWMKFSSIPKSPLPVPDVGVVEPPQTEPKRVRVDKEKGPEFVSIGHKMPPTLHPDTPAMDLLAHILASGKTSRLYRRLVVEGLAVGVDSGTSGLRDPGLFTTWVTLAPSATHEEIERVVLEEYDKIRREGILEDELNKAKNQIHAGTVFSRDGVFSVARQLSHAISVGDWTYFAAYLEKIRNVTREEVQDMARRYFVPGTMTVGYLVTQESDRASSSAALSAESGRAMDVHDRGEAVSEETSGRAENPPDFRPENGPEEEGDTASGMVSYADRVRQTVTGDIKVLSLATEVRDVVVLRGSFEGAGSAYSANPVLARFAAMMLDKQTQGRERFEIAKLFEDRGAHVSYSIDYRYLRFSLKCLSKDIGFLIPLMAEQMQSPLWDPEEFEEVKRQEVVRLRYAMNTTSSQGFNALSRHLFRPAHPYYQEPFEKQLEWVEKTSLQDVKDFHDRHYGLQGATIVVVGDFDYAEVTEAIRKGFEGWPRLELERPYRGEAGFSETADKVVVPVPDKVNLDVFAGHGVDLRRGADDFLAAYMANYIFGGNFTARLSDRIRDKYGLTYSIQSALLGITDDLEGAWLIHFIVNPPMLDEALEKVMEEARSFREKGISEKELRDRKNTVIGRFKIGLATTGGIAGQLLGFEELKLGFEYVDRFPSLIRELSRDQVHAAIRRYYYPDRFDIIVAGNPPES